MVIMFVFYSFLIHCSITLKYSLKKLVINLTNVNFLLLIKNIKHILKLATACSAIFITKSQKKIFN